MPKVEFLQDFQGKETHEVFYKKGQIADLPEHVIDVLVKDERVKVVSGSPADVTPQMDEGVLYVEQPEQVTHTTFKNRRRGGRAQ